MTDSLSRSTRTARHLRSLSSVAAVLGLVELAWRITSNDVVDLVLVDLEGGITGFDQDAELKRKTSADATEGDGLNLRESSSTFALTLRFQRIASSQFVNSLSTKLFHRRQSHSGLAEIQDKALDLLVERSHICNRLDALLASRRHVLVGIRIIKAESWLALSAFTLALLGSRIQAHGSFQSVEFSLTLFVGLLLAVLLPLALQLLGNALHLGLFALRCRG